MTMLLPKPELGEPCNSCGLCCMARVCSAGSIALGLVEKWGERAEGPCPALTEDNNHKLVCGIMKRPTNWLAVRKSTSLFRQAFGLLAGIGAGCDSPGDELDETAQTKLFEIKQAYVGLHSIDALLAAARFVEGTISSP